MVGRDKWLASHPFPPPPPSAQEKAARKAELEPKVRGLIAALDDQGRWVTPAGKRKVQGLLGPWIEMGAFDANVRTLCDYLEVAPRWAGDGGHKRPRAATSTGAARGCARLALGARAEGSVRSGARRGVRH